jgi:hypothetical protein
MLALAGASVAPNAVPRSNAFAGTRSLPSLEEKIPASIITTY